MSGVFRCPSVSISEVLASCAENFQPDLAVPDPVRCAAHVHLENQCTNRAITGLFRQTSGGHDVENRLRQTRQIMPNPPAEMSV